MKKSLTKLIGISLLAVAMTVTTFPTNVRAAEIGDQTVLTESNGESVIESNLKVTEEATNSIEESLKSPVDIEEESFEQPIEDLSSIQQGNNYPVVLVHGFLGWGRDEVLGFKYWGGTTDLQEKMRDAGYEVYTATVGPVSSNWDRACELYAYIVGGTVDYGEAHSTKFGHERYGRTYPGIYKKVSNDNKIHLVGHSMGGQTVRTITQLLSEGSEEERAYGQNNMSPLFEGGKHWIHSVTTIATPNDGTTAADATPIVDMASPAFGILGSATGHNSLIQNVFDFKLDQWGLTKKNNESQFHYLGRILSSDVWEGTKDISSYDLTTYGAEELNSWVKAQPDVYYFSWTVCGTKEAFFTGHSIPQPGVMNPMFYKNSLTMGKYTRDKAGRPVIDESWWPNDGYVNCISEDGPKLGSDDVIVDYDGTPEKGEWNSMPTLMNMDHEDIIGRFGNVKGWYINRCEQLSSLPQ